MGEHLSAWSAYLLSILAALAALLHVTRPRRKGLPMTDGWTFGSGARVRMRLSPGVDAAAELARLGFSDVTVYRNAVDIPAALEWSISMAGPGPWAVATAPGGFVPYGPIIATEQTTLFPIDLDAPEGVVIQGTIPTRPEVTSATSYLPDAFYADLVALAGRHGWDPAAILSVMFSESGVKAAPVPWSTSHPAVGLIQFDGTLPGVGYTGTPAQFQTLTADAQLPYVEKYYVQDKLPAGASAMGVYLVNFAPAYVSHWNDPSFVLYSSSSSGTSYSANASVFDVNPTKGYITVGDLTRHLSAVLTGSVWAEHLARLNYAIALGGGGGGVAALVKAALPTVGAVAFVALAGVATWAYVQGTPAWLSRLLQVPRRSARTTG